MPRGTKAQPVVVLKVIPCKFAFDASDPYCATCNGMEIQGDDGSMLLATECGAYSPTEGVEEQPVIDEVAEEQVEEPAEIPVENVATNVATPVTNNVSPSRPNAQSAANAKVTTAYTSEPIPKTPKPPVPPKETPVEVVLEQPEQNIDYNTSPAGIQEIGAESGVSVEIKDKFGNARWYKFVYSEKRYVDPTRDIEEQRRELWADVNRVVDDQIAETIDSLQL